MIVFNPFTGNFDFVGSSSQTSSDNFSYQTVTNGATVTIPRYQQMIVAGLVVIEGQLNIDGELCIIT